MEKFKSNFSNGVKFRAPTVPNFVTIKVFKREVVISLKELSEADLLEYAEIVKRNILEKHKK